MQTNENKLAVLVVGRSVCLAPVFFYIRTGGRQHGQRLKMDLWLMSHDENTMVLGIFEIKTLLYRKEFDRAVSL